MRHFVTQYYVEHMLLAVAYPCDAICMQDWLEQIAFVCFVSLDEEDDERTCPERAEQRGWGVGLGALKDVKRGAGKWFLL